jgi:1,4-dihydroxy-2-naphthoate octaprenyltransferase
MDDEKISREIEALEREFVQDAIDECERGLDHDDTDFVRRMHRIRRAEMTREIAVFVLLAVGAVLLTVGFATLLWPTWVAATLLFLASFAVDHYHQTLR